MDIDHARRRADRQLRTRRFSVSTPSITKLPSANSTQHDDLRAFDPVLRHGGRQSSLPSSQSLYFRYHLFPSGEGHRNPRTRPAGPPIQHRPWLHHPNSHHVSSFAGLSHAEAEDVRDPNLAGLPSVDATHPVVSPEHHLQIHLHRDFGKAPT